MKLPLYVFGKQTLETFLLAALEGCESKQEVYISTHKMHQTYLLNNTTGAVFLALELEDESMIKALQDEVHLLVDNTNDVLDSYESESPVIKDVIAFVRENRVLMKKWYTKTYGSPTSLRKFMAILSEVLYQGRDFNALLDVVGTDVDLKSVAATWSQSLDEHGILVIHEISPTKADAEVIFKSVADVERITGLHVYSKGVLKCKIIKEYDEI